MDQIEIHGVEANKLVRLEAALMQQVEDVEERRDVLRIRLEECDGALEVLAEGLETVRKAVELLSQPIVMIEQAAAVAELPAPARKRGKRGKRTVVNTLRHRLLRELSDGAHYTDEELAAKVNYVAHGVRSCLRREASFEYVVEMKVSAGPEKPLIAAFKILDAGLVELKHLDDVVTERNA